MVSCTKTTCNAEYGVKENEQQRQEQSGCKKDENREALETCKTENGFEDRKGVTMNELRAQKG